VKGSSRWLNKIYEYIPDLARRVEKTTEKVTEDSRSPGKDMNPIPEYEVVLLTTRPRCSVL
jgi:hypothetical protein